MTDKIFPDITFPGFFLSEAGLAALGRLISENVETSKVLLPYSDKEQAAMDKAAVSVVAGLAWFDDKSGTRPDVTIPGWLLDEDAVASIMYEAVEMLWDFADGPSTPSEETSIKTFVEELRLVQTIRDEYSYA